VIPDLDGIKLSDVRLAHANLSGARLRRAVLQECNLHRSDLNGADFSGAILTACDLTEADLRYTVCRDADLRRVNLTGAKLDGADLSHAVVGRTTFGDLDMSGAIGLEYVSHMSRSIVGLETLFLSSGQIPESFLRGAGVAESFITYMRSLTGAALEFYSCFISYSTKDQDFADRLHADMQARGVRCWFAPHDIQGGRKIHEQIDEAIRVYDKLLLILSDASMSSNWVKTEIANARARETQQKRQMLFPITLVPFEQIRAWRLFDADTGIDSAREIREYYLPDFSNWKDHDSYSAAFERLVRDLKAGPESKGAVTPE
jgi:uncharacterized protein YjbI with pentapeptide repeats